MTCRVDANHKQAQRGATRVLAFAFFGLPAASVVSCLAVVETAHAELSGNFSIAADHDDNVFRQPAGTVNSPGMCRSDNSGVAQGTLDADFGDTTRAFGVVPSVWSGDLAGTAAESVYNCNKNLNNTDAQTSFAVASPAFGPLDFSLKTSLIHQLSLFEETGNTIPNVQTLLQVNGRGEFRVTPDIALLFDPTFSFSHNGNSIYIPQDYKQYGADVGVGYFSPLGNSFAVVFKKSSLRGRFPELVTDGGETANLRNNSDENSVEGQLTYNPSVLTTIVANVGYASRTDKRALPDLFASLRSNYKGLIGNVSLDYHPSDLTRIQLSATRQLASQDFLFVNGTRTDLYSFKIEKKLFRTVSVKAQAAYINQQLNYNPLSSLPVISSNRLFNADAGLSWEVLRGLSIAVDVSRQQRLGGGILAPFKEKSFVFQIVYAFGKPLK